MPEQDKDSLLQYHSELVNLRSELKQYTQKLDSAFPKDEFNEIDYQGHRLFHRNQAELDQRFKDSKAAITRNIITWAIIGIVTVLASGLLDGRLIGLFLKH